VHRAGVEVREVQGHVPAVGPGAAPDGAGHDVARAQVGLGVLAGHEGVAGGVAQHRAGPAHGLADQGQGARGHREGGGVELGHLEVREGRAGAGGQGHAVGGGADRVGRAGEQVAHAAGGEDHGARRPHVLVPAGVAGAHPGRPPVPDQDLEHDLARADGDAGIAGDRQGEGRRDVPAGGVAPGVDDPRTGVGALAGEREAAVGVPVEVHSEGDEVGHPGRAAAADLTRGLGVDQAGAGPQGVQHVGGHRVVRPHRGGEPALGVPGAPVAQEPLGDQEHRTVGGQAECQRQAGRAAAHHDHRVVCVGAPPHLASY
jgi:hypothetical protein